MLIVIIFYIQVLTLILLFTAVTFRKLKLQKMVVEPEVSIARRESLTGTPI
jgi:hypothetical protein